MGQYVDLDYKFFDTKKFIVSDNLDTMITTHEGLKRLKEIVQEFDGVNLKQLSVYKAYKRGLNYHILTMPNRRINPAKSDKRVSTPFGQYIPSIISKVATGRPPVVKTTDDQNKKNIDEMLRLNDFGKLIQDIAFEISAMGVAYTYHYWKEFSPGQYNDRIILVDSTDVIPLYSDDIEQELIGIIHVRRDLKQNEYTLYTSQFIYKLNKDFKLTNTKEHRYKRVPWDVWVNKDGQPDIAPVLSSIIGYDELLSNRQNWSLDSTQGTYVANVLGDVIDEDDDSDGDGDLDRKPEIVDANMLIFQARQGENGGFVPGGTLDFISKSYDVAGSQEDKNTLYENILFFTGVPDFRDPQTYAMSGIAIERRWMSLVQKVKEKQAILDKGFLDLVGLTENIFKSMGKRESINSSDVWLEHSLNFPENKWEEIKSVVAAGGRISNYSLLRSTSNFSPEEESENFKKDEKLGIKSEEVTPLHEGTRSTESNSQTTEG